MHVLAISSPRAADWRWRIVDMGGETLEESSMTFATIALAMAAGEERLARRRDLDRPAPARVPWHRRR
jgi:hypothetical protein